MKLGQLIEWLEKQNPGTVVPVGFTSPHSYRGYYNDLAFEPVTNVSFDTMLKDARAALDKTFTGYKGGEFLMHENVDVYLSNYGRTGQAISLYTLAFMKAWGEHEIEEL